MAIYETFNSFITDKLKGVWKWFSETNGNPIDGYDYDYGWRCSVCEFLLSEEYDNPDERPLINFCPRCGAAMTREAVNVLTKKLDGKFSVLTPSMDTFLLYKTEAFHPCKRGNSEIDIDPNGWIAVQKRLPDKTECEANNYTFAILTGDGEIFPCQFDSLSNNYSEPEWNYGGYVVAWQPFLQNIKQTTKGDYS